MLGDRRARHVEVRCDLACAQLAVPDKRENLPPPRSGDRLQRSLHAFYVSKYLRKKQLTLASSAGRTSSRCSIVQAAVPSRDASRARPPRERPARSGSRCRRAASGSSARTPSCVAGTRSSRWNCNSVLGPSNRLLLAGSGPSGGGPSLSAQQQGKGGSPVATTRREAHELLLIEEADAWFEYLAATRGQSAVRYKEVEPWAWARLSQRLRAIRTKRQKLRPARAA